MKKGVYLKLIDTGVALYEADSLIYVNNTAYIIAESSKHDVVTTTGERFPINKHTQTGKSCVVLPYGLSDDVIREGDKYYNPTYDCIVGSNSATNIDKLNSDEYRDYKKVVLLPEQFNYQELVGLGLKDNDQFLMWYDPFAKREARGFSGHAIIERLGNTPEPKVTIDARRHRPDDPTV